MAYPTKLLEDGETVVLDLHPHWRALVIPLGLIPIVVGLAVYGAVRFSNGYARIAILAGALVLLGWFSLIPYLKWVTTNYVVTSRRVVIREGVLAREGRDIPLGRINDVTFQHTVVERLLRSGTLAIESAGERGEVVLDDVPKVEEVQRTVYRLVEAEDQRRRTWSAPPGVPPPAVDTGR